MVDTVRIEELTGASELIDGEEVPTRTLVYQGKARFRSVAPYEQKPNVPGGNATVLRNGLSIPISAGPAEVGHVVTCITSALDPFMAGREYRVASPIHDTHATAQRLALEENL